MKDKEWLKQQVKTRDVIMDRGYIYTEDVMKLVCQLEEPEITEEKGFLEHLTRLFKKHGYDHLGQVALALENDLEISINKELPVIPQFVADYIEGLKYSGQNFYGSYYKALSYEDINSIELGIWINNEENLEIFATAYLNGYTIEPPKTLQVIIKKYDSTVYTTELPEDEAMKLIEGWKG